MTTPSTKEEGMSRTETETTTFDAAFAAAKAAFPAITRNADGQIGPRKYKYTDLAHLSELVDPVLRDHGLDYIGSCHCDSGYVVVSGKVAGHGGQHEAMLSFPIPGDIQDFGKVITYLRRYVKSLVLDVASEDDDDGSGVKPLPKPAPTKRRPSPPHQHTEHELQDDPLPGTDGLLISERPDVRLDWADTISTARARFFHTIAGKWAKVGNVDADVLAADALGAVGLEHASDLTNGQWKTAIWELASRSGIGEAEYQDVVAPKKGR